MIKAVIFDMDGVLIDSQPIHYEADRLTLAELGVEVTHETLSKYAGTSNPNRWSRLKNDYNLQPSVEELIIMQEAIIYNLLDREHITAIDGIPELLDSLTHANLKIAVASSSSYRFINTIIEKIKIEKYLTKVVSGEDMEHGKPAPDIFLATARELEVSPEECIVIEDSMNGVLAAYRANMKCVGYININSGEQDLSKSTIIIDDFRLIDADKILRM